MKSCTCRVSLALTVLSLLGLAIAARAQQPPTNLVPIKVTETDSLDRFVIPLNPPILSTRVTGTGQATLLGSFTSVGHYLVHLGADGKPVSATDGIVVLTAANGDALFFTATGLYHPVTTPGVLDAEGVVIFTGGSGRFAGVTGSGTFRAQSRVLPTGKVELTVTTEGIITAPKP